MLGKLFITAAEHGISQEQVRDEIAPGLIGKRLSAASESEISQVLEHITGRRYRNHPHPKQYPSTMQGLKDEIRDMAKVRWGSSDWENSLNNLCRRFGIDHYLFLDMRHGKAVKQRLIDWTKTGPFKP